MINLCELLSNNDFSKQEITAEYDFNERQADYYANAGRYLGLVEKTAPARYALSTSGRQLFAMSWKNRQLSLCRLILSHRVFHETLELYFRTGTLPDITSIIQRSCSITGDTLTRRASTVRSWLNWITSLITD